MPTIIGVKFKNTNKVYYFDPQNERFFEEDGVIVETARGTEFGRVVQGNREVSDGEVVSPLKPVIRKATAEDFALVDKLEGMRDNTFKNALPHIERLNPEIKLVDVEHTFDQSKIVFYFTADGRVDFRELVKALAGTFRKRIEMRQIDEREDIKLRGGLGSCGRPCCCTCFMADSEKVSIKMAKNQGLPLNPTKINGLCGKLMCCLRYENEYYSEVNKLLPKNGSKVVTPDGEGTVVSTDALKQLVRVRIEREDGVSVNDFELESVKKVEQRNEQTNRASGDERKEKQGKSKKEKGKNNKKSAEKSESGAEDK